MSHFQLFHEFQGRLTQERLILAGVYEVDDPRLRGLESYFAENELGAYVGEDVPLSIEPLRQDIEKPVSMSLDEAQKRLGVTFAESALVDPNSVDLNEAPEPEEESEDDQPQYKGRRRK
jgi:hypothetical protein